MPIRPTSSPSPKPLPNVAGVVAGERPALDGGQGPVDARSANAGDSFEGAENDPMVDAALDKFAGDARYILGENALGMAERAAGLRRGEAPVGHRPASLTDDQADALTDATIEMVKAMPLRALSPELTAKVEGVAKAAGRSGAELGATRLGDLGKLGSDLAKESVERLRDENPRAFWSLAGTVAAGSAVVGYLRGSEGLERLGIRPKLSTSLGDNTKLKLRADWKERFTEAGLDATVHHNLNDGLSLKAGGRVDSQAGLTALRLGIDHRFEAGGARVATELSAEATENSNGEADARLRLNNTISRGDFRLSNALDIDGEGIVSGRSKLSFKDSLDGAGALEARFGRNAELERIGGSYELWRDLSRGGHLYVNGAANYDLRDDRFESRLSAGYRRDNLDLGLVAGRDKTRGNFVGLGVKVDF